ncbi:IQ calmodulin-binding motif [Plasmodiophora brassicae]|uniref:Uncharacterized protein n=1 Tax=Plasmodiophora brassicae TaxID=37360 RepID=A0A0G4J7F2_PLABS|nr:hypothetical protein PBRA_009400 [Plasmodiophora brassicae]SPQ96537.1 unnamed protein product [Plasmodiophora brassicae]
MTVTSSHLYSKQAVSDLVLLTTIDENNILSTLKSRHASNEIYTYIGSVLLSVNPFKQLSLYGDAYISKYRGRYMYELPPHIYALAEDAINALRNNHTDQCVIISGESGAGKTEASKLFMQYIAAVSSNVSDIQRIKDQILQTSSVLEAFGNAATRRNTNSSRFGKYMEISFNFQSDPIGGSISNFLLEKSRIVQTGAGERSFHIFYQLTRGANATVKSQYFVEDPEYFNFLKASGSTVVKGYNDKDEFKMTLSSLAAMDIPAETVSEILRIVSAVLWLGQIEFTKAAEKPTGSNGALITIDDKDGAVKKVAELLKCSEADLRKAFLFRSVNAGKEASISKPLDLEQGNFTRDAFAKLVYDRLFQWIVRRINDTIAPKAQAVAKIGILDIYGFEIFDYNSFEQMCINYANEKLQQVFIARTLQAEQAEYDAEGISWQHIDYFDNKVVVDLIEKKPYGILAYLDEACVVPKGDVSTFQKSLLDAFSSHKHWSTPKQLGTSFTIAHYAGNVTYNADLFLIKNKDLAWSDLLELGEHCSLDICREMFPAGEGVAVNQKRPLTAGSQFRIQVNQLSDKLNKCEPHYIRCIKPNDEKRPAFVDDAMVLHQIKYLGLLENVRVRRAGFAYRMEFERFLNRYKMLSPATWPTWNGDHISGGVREILTEMKLLENSQYVMGKTKVFIREPISLFTLEELRNRRLHDLATMIQKVYRSWIARKYYKELRERAIGLFGDRKMRRLKSFSRPFFGDYEGGATEPHVQSLLQKNGVSRILFFDKVLKINRRLKMQNRLLLLSETFIFNLTSKFKFKRRIHLSDITAISVSPLSDNVMVIHVSGEYDYVYSCERKTEFITALSDQFMAMKKVALEVQFNSRIEYSTKNHQVREILFESDPSVGEDVVFDPVNTTLKVRVGKIPVVSAKQVEAKRRESHARQSTLQPEKRGLQKTLSNSPGITAFTPKGSEGPVNANAAALDTAVALYDFKAADSSEISFAKGDTMTVLQKLPDGWFQVDLDGKLGYAPGNHVKLVKTEPKVRRQVSRHGNLPQLRGPH